MKAADLLVVMPVRQWVSLGQLAEKMQLKPAQVAYLLKTLVSGGLVEKKGKTKGTLYRRGEAVTREFKAFPLPREVGDYWAISTEYKTLRGHYWHYDKLSVASLYRTVNIFKALGLVEMERGKGELNQAGKRVKRFRRKYRSVTFRDDGTVLFE